jgi:hypothetical protein
LLHLDPNLKSKSQNIISKQYLEVTKYYPTDKAMINVIKETKGTVAIKITLLLIMEEYYKYI